MCITLLDKLGIDIPAMYRLGYHNNNCIGCVKGGMGYWNKIRVDFPDTFAEMAKLEREVGASCIRHVYLDELDPKRGRKEKPLVGDCGVLCGVEFGHIESPLVEKIISGEEII